MRWKIGEALVQAGLISPDDLRIALTERKGAGEHLGEVLVRMGLATETQIAAALARQLGFTHVDLIANPPDPTAVVLVPEELSRRYRCIALGVQDDVLTVAMADPLQLSLVRELEVKTGYRVRQAIATASQIENALTRIRETALPSMPVADASGSRDRLPSAVSSTQLEQLFADAVESGADEVSIEPIENGARIRTRREGHESDVVTTKAAAEDLVDHIKARAGLVDKARFPQQGRLRAGGLDYRVTTFPVIDGERLVVRAQSLQQVPVVEELGLAASALVDLRGILRGRGVLLVAGPANSGKTTTLTSLAGAISGDLGGRPMPSIVDDVSGDARMASALEAAKMGIVLVSARVDDTTEALVGSSVAGIDLSPLVADLVGVVQERLVRRLCEQCRRLTPPSPSVREALGLTEEVAADLAIFSAVGCELCGHTGYRGLAAIFEVIAVDDETRRAMASGPAMKVRQTIGARGIVTLAEIGLAAVIRGVTTAEELVRVLGSLGPTRRLCPGCGSPVEPDFAACPACGERLGAECAHCGRALQPAWTVCPYCARPAGQEPFGVPSRSM